MAFEAKQVHQVQIVKKNIVKSNSLISARYTQKYSLHEQKTIFWILGLIDEKSMAKNEYEISIKEYANFLEVDPSYIYQEAENIAKKLASKAIKIDDNNGGWTVCSWISGMRYTDGKLYLSIYDGLKPYLLNLKSNFTKIQLQSVMMLSSSYAIRVYEILAQFIKIGSRTVDLGVLREMLGVGENELKQFVHFKTKVLEISEREINSKTDIEFSWEPIKSSRKIVSIKFNIRRKQSMDLDIEIDDLIRSDLEKFGFNLREMSKLCKDYDQEFIRDKIEYLKYNIKNGKDIKEPKSWLISAIVEDYNTIDMPRTVPEMPISPKDQTINELNEKVSQARKKVLEVKSQLNSHLAKYDENLKKIYEDQLTIHQAEFEKLKGEFERVKQEV